jgi:transcriptional regulator with PAS, ATPase and Fis domain
VTHSSPRAQHQLVGDSPVAHALDELIQQAARSDAKVLITGESGVGKEIAAQLVHARSARARGRLVTINCAGVPDTLLESEFFGHVRGSFTGAYRDRPGLLEQADNGTVFLDEIGEMSLRLQGLLLRFLETGEVQRVGSTRPDRRVNVRVISASNRSLEDEVARQAFRGDLFYRLNVIRLEVPPLRTRLDDLPLLVRHFIDQFSAQYQLGVIDIDDDVFDMLRAYAWPGNIRELRNMIERTLVRLSGTRIAPEDLPGEVRRAGAMQRVAQENGAAERSASAANMMLERMVARHESFWTVVYEPFMTRDLTRQQIRELVAIGLAEANGDYKRLATLFNVEPPDFKRFIAMLRRYDCQVALQPYRKPMMKVESPRVPSIPQPLPRIS